MGIGDKVVGEVKEAAGTVINDADLEAEGAAQSDKGEAEMEADKARAEAKGHEAKAAVKEAEQEAHENRS